jgi:hypothetical protein
MLRSRLPQTGRNCDATRYLFASKRSEGPTQKRNFKPPRDSARLLLTTHKHRSSQRGATRARKKVCIQAHVYSTISTSPDSPFASLLSVAFFPLRSRIARRSLSS